MRERKDRVGGATGEKRAGSFGTENRFREGLCGPSSGSAEGGHGDGVGGNAQERAGEVVDERGPVADGAGEQQLPGTGVLGLVASGELRGSGFEAVFENNSCAVIEGMRERRGWFDPSQAIVG